MDLGQLICHFGAQRERERENGKKYRIIDSMVTDWTDSSRVVENNLSI